MFPGRLNIPVRCTCSRSYSVFRPATAEPFAARWKKPFLLRKNIIICNFRKESCRILHPCDLH